MASSYKSKKSNDRNNNALDFERYIFAGNIPKDCTKSELIAKMASIGEVDDVSIHDKDPSDDRILKFAFISFVRPEDRNKAISLDGKIDIRGKPIHVEERKPKEDAVPEPPDNAWDDLLKDFEWRQSAAIYCFRHRTMEDYLADFLHTYACIRKVDMDHIENLSHLLTKMSETKPIGLTHTLPPNLSGMIVNMKSRSKKKWELKGLRDVVLGRADWFRLTDNTIHYIGRMMRVQEATDHLREIIVEGLFIYFFAKFSHGEPFDIKYNFYARSEPIRTILLTLMGKSRTDDALHAYFNLMNEVFHYDPKARQLTLLVDYFHGPSLHSLKPYLPHEFQEIFTGIGQVLEVGESKRESKIKFRYKKRAEKTAYLFLDDWYCATSELQVGVTIHFSAILDEGRMVWHCTAAWIPGKAFYNLKGKIRFLDGKYGLVTAAAPDGSELHALFERQDLLVERVDKNHKVFLDVAPSNLTGLPNEYSATLLWTGVRPDDHAIVKNKMRLGIDDIFAYLEREPKYMALDFLPEVVKDSIEEFVNDHSDDFKFDQRFINVAFFDFVCNNLISNSRLNEFTPQVQHQLLSRLQEETKNALAGIMADFDLRKY